MDYNETQALIKSKEKVGMHLGLERIQTALSALGSPQDKIKTVHIAGTNGKGSVASSIANSLSAAGFRTGLFTSPWVIDYREQIQLDGEFISEKSLSRLFETINKAFPGLTEFELLTAAAFLYFCDEAVDFAVIECGMGGVSDATNVIKSPVVSVITEISADHTEFLGKSLAEIAENKAGIIKENGIAVVYPNGGVMNVFEDVCKAKNARLIRVPARGNFLQNNRETVRTSLAEMGLNIPIFAPTLPARLEKIGESILLDGSHNPSAARALADCLKKDGITGVTAVISMMKDKNIDVYLETVAPLCKKIYACRAGNPRAASAAEMAAAAKKYCPCVAECESPVSALESAVKGGGFVLICGSFYLARDIRKSAYNAVKSS